MSIPENGRKRKIFFILELYECVKYLVFIHIGKNGSAAFNKFNPFGFRAKNDAGFFKEEGFFLHATRISADEHAVFFQHDHFKKRNRSEERRVGKECRS